jgi:hypothetical protein
MQPAGGNSEGTPMSDDDFNMSMRKFLKQVGVTSQQEIEAAVRAAREAGKLPAGGLNARMVLTIDEIGMRHVVDGKIKTGGDA